MENLTVLSLDGLPEISAGARYSRSLLCYACVKLLATACDHRESHSKRKRR